jgi:hypothetical protein
MMLSKHGLWKFVDGSARIPNDENTMMDDNEKATPTFALLCEQTLNLHTFKYCENVCMKQKSLDIFLF